MVATHSTATLFLGLTAAASLILSSTALPAPAPYGSSVPSLPNLNLDLQPKDDESIITGSSPFMNHLAPPPSFTSFSPPPHQQHDLHVHSFLETSSRARTSARDQILHQCTDHFLALLDSEISSRLTAQLSRLVMMVPVIGVETRSVMKSKVIEVMDDVSAGLTNYNAVRRVIRTAVDDAGLLPTLDDDYHHRRRRRRRRLSNGGELSRKRQSQDDGIKRILYYDSDDHESEEDGADLAEDFEGEEEEAKDSTWFRLSVARKDPQMDVDESQIPSVVQVAMEAVLDYAAEILTPTLVIHQLTEAIQETLQQISKHRALQGFSSEDDTTGEADHDINVLSSQSLARAKGDHHHGLDLLSDDWVWSASASAADTSGSEDEDEADSDRRGQDEDLWDQDMEINEWDSNGRLFDDLVDGEESTDGESTLAADPPVKDWDMTAGDDDDDNPGLETYPFAVGIHDGNEPYADEDEDDEYDRYRSSLKGDTSGQKSFSRFHKRAVIPGGEEAEPGLTTISTSSLSSSLAILSAEADGLRLGSDDAVVTKRRDGAGSLLSKRRRPSFAPDPRLENLLTQLIEPILTTFTDEDFPASCKRVQGELMDGIIWSLDEGELSGGSEESERDQLALLAELEF